MKFAWTEESTQVLIDMVGDRKEYATIAAALQERFGYPVSRGMIAGKVHRLKLDTLAYRPAKNTPQNPGVTYGARELPTEPAPEGYRYVFQGPAGQRGLVGLVPIERPVKIIEGVPLMALRETSCRWPLWGDDERPEVPMYCGETISPTEIYCDCHKKRAFQPRIKKAPVDEKTRLARRIVQLRRHEKERQLREAKRAAR